MEAARVVKLPVRQDVAVAGEPEQGGLPNGTVALLLSDVEGSTRLWAERPEETAAATVALDVEVSAAVARHGGARPLEQGEGDSFVAAFATVSAALACAIDVQRATAGGLLRLRMGIHVGEVLQLDEVTYAGPTVNRTARVRDAGHGGQILLSHTAASLAADVLLADVSLDDLGEHRLRDLPRPERIWQLVAPGLGREFPPLRSVGSPMSNVPMPLTALIGRDDELGHVDELLADHRCVTVTGAGGCGKTRLAAQTAVARIDEPNGACWFVDLAAVDDGAGVGPAIADALGLEAVGGEVDRRLAAAIGDQEVLLVLDNCEHVLGVAAGLTDSLLRRCSGLRVLATSREPLGVSGEVTYRLPSLPPPTARELFVDRAQRAVPSFEPSAAELDVIDDICARLDGIPLAIELAAARVRVFTVDQLRDGLHDRFRLLTGGARSAMPRQQTLQASVEWSYALLLEPERALLRRLGVFADGFTLEAAEDVGVAPPLDPHHVVEILAQLVDKSLVLVDRTTGRFRLLETVRQFALSKLLEAGEGGDVRRRHHDHYRRTFDSVAWSDRVEVDRARADDANIRRALQWAAEQDDPRLLATFCEQLDGYWATCRPAEGVDWTALIRHDELDLRDRAAALARRSFLLTTAGRWQEAADVGARAVDVARRASDDHVLARALTASATSQANVGVVDTALLDEAVGLAREHADRRTLAFALFAKGLLLSRGPRAADGHAALHEALVLADNDGFTSVARMSRGILAMSRFFAGEARDALLSIDDAVAELGAAEHHFFLSNAVAIRAGARAEVGDDDGADADLAWLWDMVERLQDDQTAFMAGFGTLLVMISRGQFEAAADAMVAFDRGPTGVDFAVPGFAFRALCHACLGHVEEARADCAAVPPGRLGYRVDLFVLLARGLVARQVGDLDAAWDYGREVMAQRESDEGHPLLDHVLRFLADIAGQAGRVEDAARLLGAAAARADAVGSRTDVPTVALMQGDAEARARGELGDQRFDALFAEGTGLDWTGVAAYLLRGRGARARPAIGWGSLTPTEAAVVDAVLDGHTNKEVAARLFISLATVKSHLTHAYAKLGVRSRSQLAAAARARATDHG